MKRLPFYQKIFLYLLIIGVLPTLFIAGITSVLTRKMTHDRLIHESQRTVSNTLSSIEKTLEIYTNTNETFSNSPLVYSLLKKETLSTDDYVKFHEEVYSTSLKISNSIYNESDSLQISTNVLDRQKPISNIHIIRCKDNQILSLKNTPEMYNLARNYNWGFYRKAKESFCPIFYPVKYESNNTSEIAGVSIKAVYEQNTLLGFLAFDVPLDTLTFQTTKNSEMLPINFSLVSSQNYILWNNNSFASLSNFISLPDEISENKFGYLIDNKNGFNNLLTYKHSSKYNLILLGGINMDLVLGNLDIIVYILLFTVCFTVVLCIIFSLILSKTINTPLKTIVKSMEKMETGDFDIQIPMNREDEFGYVAKQFNSMTKKIKDLFIKDHEKQELLRISELKNLQSQINPHFIANTLDSIKYLAKIENNEEIFIMTKSLSSLLKKSFRTANEFESIQSCLKSLDDYIAIQKIRFSNKFDVIMDFEPEILDYKVPSLLLQPIVENAMLHGIEPSPKQGLLTIIGYRSNQMLIIRIADNGIGMAPETCQSLLSTIDHSSSTLHIGIRNIHQRIQLYYGDTYGITLESCLNKGTTVTITLPYHINEETHYD